MSSSNIEQPQVNELVVNKQRSPLWLLLWPLAIIARIYNLAGVFVNGQVFLCGSDPYLHLRRILATFNNFPHVPDKDLYLNYPSGLFVHWPYLFDIFVTIIISILTFGQADTWLITAIAALLPPIIGGLLPLIIYLIGKEIADQFTAFLAAILSALLPLTIHYSQIGNLDHHFLAPIFQASFWLTYLKASNSQEKPLFWQILSGLMLFLGFTCTTEFPLVAAMHVIFLGIAYFLATIERRQVILQTNLTIFLTSTIVFLPFIFTNYFEPNGVSPLLACSWLGCLALTIFLASIATWQKKLPLPVTLLILIIAAFSSLKFNFSLINEFFLEITSTQGSNVLATSIRENRSLLSDDFSSLLFWHSGFLFLTPVTIFLLAKRRKESDLLIGVSLLIMVMLTLLHMRFGVLLAVPFVLGSAILAKEVLLFAKNYLPKQKLGEILTTLAIILMLLPSVTGLNYSSSMVVVAGRNFFSLYESFNWLKNYSVQVNPNKPSYGVLANEWSIGHWLVYFSERPTVSSPLLFGTAAYDSAKIFIQPPKTAIKSIKERNLKYIFITPEDFTYLLKVAGNNIPASNQAIIGNLFYDSIYGQLLLYGSSETRATLSELNNFRLVYETAETTTIYGFQVPSCQIFEVVEGVSITGKAKADSIVSLTTELKNINNHRIPYSISTKTDSEGNFSFSVPYATEKDSSTTVLANPYILKSDEAIAKVNVSNQQVKAGEKVTVNLLKKGN